MARQVTEAKRAAVRGQKMAVFTLQDLQGQIEVVMFPEVLNRYGEKLVVDTVVFVKGKADYRREQPNVIAEELIALDEVREKIHDKSVGKWRHFSAQLEPLREILEAGAIRVE